MGTGIVESSTWQLQHAKNRFSEVVNQAVSGSPQWITRRDELAVCVVSARDYQALVVRKEGGIKELLRSSPHPDVELDIPRDSTTGREVDL